MLSIIIPAYNEETRIGKTLESYIEFFKEKVQNKEIDNFELLVVLNGCTDDTVGIVEELKKRFKEIRYLNLETAGKGLAIIEGFKDALSKGSELIGFVDADLATEPFSFYGLVEGLENYDGIIASRGKKGSKVETSFKRKLSNRGFNFLVRSLLFLPYKDTQCGCKLFKREAIEKIVEELGITKWAFDIDLLYKLKRRGFRVKEIPTIWENKEGSKINLIKAPIQMFSAIFRLRLIYSPFKFVVRAYDRVLPERLKIHNL